MKDGFAFLYPPPGTVRFTGGLLDIRCVSFSLEIFKKFDFLFGHFGTRNRSNGLPVVFQERCSRPPSSKPGLASEGYAIDCTPGGIVLSAASPRGQFYALSTLLQVLAFHGSSGRMPAFMLHDSPQVPFRGFMLPLAPAGIAPLASLHGLLLKLALLKFNHFALPAGAAGDPGLAAFATLARRAGMEVMLLDRDPRAVFSCDPAGTERSDLPVAPHLFQAGAKSRSAHSDEWFDFFIDRCRAGKARGKSTAVWADGLAPRPEWIRKLPQEVLVLNREVAERTGPFQAAAMPFRKHHVRQVLCPVLCRRGRFIPDARAGLARAGAAFMVAKTWKLHGVLAAGAENEGDLCLPEGAAMLHFEVGCLLWSGRSPGPAAFSHWAVGRDEPDLFRVYSFLAQSEHRLAHSHGGYLFEDPVLAPLSKQGDPCEVVAHYRKAALYLKKKEACSDELARYFEFAGKLYEFIAAKVEFSGRLECLFDVGGGREEIRRQAELLEREAAALKALYQDLRRRHLTPDAAPEIDESFAFLTRRFAFLGNAAASPAASESLLAQLKSGAAFDSGEVAEGG